MKIGQRTALGIALINGFWSASTDTELVKIVALGIMTVAIWIFILLEK